MERIGLRILTKQHGTLSSVVGLFKEKGFKDYLEWMVSLMYTVTSCAGAVLASAKLLKLCPCKFLIKRLVWL